MSLESIIFLLFFGGVSIWLSWMSLSDRAARRKRLAAKSRKHLRIVKKNEK